MSTDRDNRVELAIDVFGVADGSVFDTIARELDRLRTLSDDVLGRLVIGAGLCVDEMTDGDRPGWLFDDTSDPGVAALICAECPVADACLELELRLFGAERHGMWGSLGEDGRRALHPVWAARRGRAEDGDAVEGDQ